MALSSTAAAMAAEIAAHDWQDAPYRIDRAGHQRDADSPSKQSAQVLTDRDSDCVKTNVMWVTAQVLGYQDPGFDINEYAEACGIAPWIRLRSNGAPSGAIEAGVRIHRTPGGNLYAKPGSSGQPSIRIALNSYDEDAAICGEVKLHLNNAGFAHNIALLQPGAHAVTTFDGTAFGEGYIRELNRRGDWYVVVWDSFWAISNPYPCTAPGGRHYVDAII